MVKKHGERVAGAPSVRELLSQAGVCAEDLPEECAEAGQAFAGALYQLTRMRFEDDEAERFWREIQRHHEGLNHILGRDVGLRVAVCDYFLNLHPKMRDPVIVEVQVLLQKEQGALVDELTGLYNRRYFNDAIGREVERFKRFGQRFSLLMLDVDHFKNFNDSYGHLAGDDALKTVAGVLRAAARTFDHVVRYGGEEFALILPHTCGDQAMMAAERLRQSVRGAPIPVDGAQRRVSVSVGVAAFPDDAIDARELVARSDEALYEAKRTRDTSRAYSERNRRFPRSDIHLVVLFSAAEDSGREAVAVTAMNVSFGGMLCLSATPILPGEQVRVTLDTQSPRSRGLAVAARVVRLEREGDADSYQVALSFDLGTQEQRRDLVRLVEMHQHGEV